MKENISVLNKFSQRVPKTINEAINFNEDEDLMMNDDEPMDDEPMDDEPMHDEPEAADVDANNVESFINETRKKSLQIMAKLAEDPENPIYDIAKKIWQICDKAYNDQKEGNGLAQQQQMHQQQNRM